MKTRIKNFFPSLTFSSPFSRLPLSYLLLTFLTLFAASVASAQIPSSGLVGYWPFNGNANDESGNGNNGTVNGATLTTDRFGNANSAYSFNGNGNKIEIPNSTSLNPSQISFSFWGFFNSGNCGILSKVDPSTPENYSYSLIHNFLNDNGFYSAWNASGLCSYPVFSGGTFGPNGILSNSIWTHVVVTIDENGFCKQYMNGQLTHTYSGPPLNPCTSINSKLFFGMQWLGDPCWMNGKLDDICIWNRSLTPAEITQLYTDASAELPVVCTPFLGEDQTVCAGTSVTLSASGSSLACPTLPSNLQNGLVGYWPFCGNANDASGNGNNGTVSGATLTTDRFGNANSAYSFDGSPDRIDLGQNLGVPIGSPNSSWSCSAWVNRNNYNGVLAISDYQGSDNYVAINLQVDQGVANAGIRSGANNDFNVTGGTITANQWHFIAFTVSQTGLMSLYVDGQFVTATSINSNFNFYENPAYRIGASNFGGNYTVGTGLIDNVAIHSRALSASEIQQLYTLGQSTYLWSTGATTATINVTPSTTTTYTCAVTDANGNLCTDSVTVFVPQIEATDLTICAGETTTLSVSGINSTATLSACSALPSNLQTGLVGYWPFCGNANDASGNGNNGTVNGATLTTDRFGNANSAYSFDGVNDFIQCLQAGPTGNPNLSMSFWLKTQSSSYGHLIGYGNNAASGQDVRVLINGNCPSSIAFDTYDNQKAKVTAFTNVWDQYTIIYNGSLGNNTSVVSVYKNGVFLNTECLNVNVSPTNISSLIPIRFGRYHGTAQTGYLDGMLDDITIYNRLLSSDDIQQLYTLGQTTYLWSNGATTPTINVSPTSTTTYTCTVTTNGVSCTDSVTVLVSNPVIDLGADVTICGTSTTLTAPSGYDSYVWSNGGTTNTTTVNASGTYSCTATQGGCSATDAIDVTLIDATITASDSIICAGEIVTLSVPQAESTSTICAALPTNLQTGLVGYWPFCGNANDASGNGNNGSVNGATLTTDRFGNANSAYSFSTIDQNFIAVSQNGMSNDSGTYVAWINFDGPIAEGNPNLSLDWYTVIDPLMLNSNSNSSNYRKLLFNLNNQPTSSENLTFYDWHQIAVTVEPNANVTFFIDGINCGSQSITNSYSLVSFSNLFLIGKSSNNAWYWNGKIDDITIYNRALSPSEIQQLYTLGQSTYLWSTGATTATINVSPTTTTTYTCTVTTNGVSCTDSVTVVVNNPTIDLGSDVTACGTSTTLTAPSGYDSYLWSNGATTNTTTVSANGTYTCTVTQGGCSASDSIDVTLIDATITASDSTICAGESIVLSVPQVGSSNTACAALPTNLQTGLVGYWPFCGNANDASGNGNNGTVNGATLTTDRFGNSNSAYSFDGNDWIESLIPQTLGYTVSGWVFLNTNSNYNGFAQHKNNCGRGGGYILGIPNGGDVRLLRQNCGECGNNCGAEFSISNFSNVGIGEWKHLVATCDAINSHKVYLNGQLVYTQTNSSSIGQYGQQLFSIGKHHDSPDLYFLNGKADDFLLYNRALTATEIQQLYNLGQTTYLWSNGATTPTINVSPTSTTTYTCTVTTNGVSCTDSVTVAVNNSVIDLGADVTVCGTSTTLTAPSGYDSYLWSNGGTTNTTTVNANGTYSCTATQGGCSASDSIDVTLVDATIAASDSTICAGETVTLSVPQGGSSSAACAALPTNLQTGLVGYWPFCGNANDASGNGNNGTVNGATLTTDRFGNANSAYSFDGASSVIKIFNSTTLSFPNNITISAWVYRQSNSTLPEGIFGPATYLPSQPGYFLRVIDNKLNLSISQPYVGGQSNQLISSGQWYFVSGTYDNNSIKTYVNGILNGETVVGSGYLDSWASSNPLTIGQEIDYASTNLHPWNGLLDDIGIWNRALTANEIQEIFSQNATTYLWSNGATTPTINVSPATTTTYTCTITTNGVSCTDSVTVIVSQPVASITPNGIVEICQGQSIALTANGGVSYLWNTGAPTQSITVNTEGLYTVTATDANGCTDTESQFVKVNFLPNIGVNNASICSGQSTTLTATGGLSYVWSPATGLSSTTGTTVTASPSTSTVYTVTGTGANGCTNTATAAVAVNAAPTATITPATATTFCQGGSVVLNANTGTGLTYQWFNNAVAISGATSSSYTANASGSYTVVVTNTSTCSATSAGTVVTVNALPTATITPATATTFCQGGSVVLNANTGTGLTYQWRLNGTNITGATSSSYTANASGSYTVVVTNTSTCSATSTATVVTVNALPTATITASSATAFCQGGSVVLNANTGTGLSYQWFNNAVAISGATTSTYTANASGSYTVVVTNTSTCSATSTATVVTVNALPTATITPATVTTFCQGGSVVLNANTGTGLSYQWRLNGTNITGATTSSYTANASGSYTVFVTNTSTCSATSAATVVTVNALPTATITPATATTFCQGGSVVLNANTGTGLSYQWRLNGTNITGATSSSYTANASGSYTVIVTNTSTCSATSTATVVTVNALPSSTITPATATTFCQGGSVVLNANTGAGLSYQWRLNGTNITGATSSSYTANASGSYTVVVTNTSTCSATSAATVVTVNALPTATITPATATTFCQGGSVVLNANTGAGLTYQWFNNAVAIGGATTSTYTANASGSYTVAVTNTSTCSSTSAATVVTVNALPTATITPATATTFCQGGSVVLNANTGTGLSYQWRLNGTNISGATTSSYTANASGSYTVVVTNTSTCSATSTATVVTVNALPTATITPATATTFCQGGSVVLNANTGTGLSYQWFNNAVAISGATSSIYTANSSGSYTVVVTNTSTCSASSTATVVTVNALPSSTITPATATTFCQGGSVVLNANTGAGLSYQWFNNAVAISGATTSAYTANASGSYTVVVTNTSTCSSTSTATVVTVNALPTATITASSATTFCQGGSVVLNANTGTGLTYQWRLNGTNITGATSSTYTANASGSFTVVVTNTSTCSSTSTSTVVTVNPLPTATITPTTATTFCQGGSVVLNANTGTGLSYQWRLNGTNISGATTASYTANASGSYTVVVTNASTCSATSAATVVTVNALPIATITPATTTTFCQGGSVVLNANTGTGLSYQWRLNGTNITGATSSSYTANASGSYTVVVTNSSTCSATSTATVVTVNALPTATIIPATATTFCQGGSVVLNANTGAGLSYQWFNNATAISGATSASYTATTSGSYTVVVTNTSTCSATSTATVVTVNALPTATITAATATTFCQGGSVVLNANTGTGLTYQWKLNGTNITGATSASYTANASGSYTVVVTNTSTCSATSTATVVTVNALPTATITPATTTTFCQGGSVVLNANTGTGLTYQWFNNAVAISGATSSSYTANASGSYTVVVTNTSTCSATSTATVVTVNALPSSTITPATATTFCQGGSVVLSANTGTGLSYQWFNNAVAISGATTSTYTANASGSYTVVVTNTSTCSVTSAATIVTVNALPIASISPNGLVEICEGQSIALTANGGVSYLWSTGAPTQSITVNTEALYTVTVTDINGCTDTESQFVKVNQLPNIAVNNASICAGQSATLTATGGLSYVWSPATGLSATTGSTVSSSTTTNAAYTVTGTGANGCTNSATAMVTVNALPTATTTLATATTFCQGGSVVLNANTGTGLTYQWRLNGTNITGATSSSYTANASGSYTVVVTNTSTCSATSTAIDVTAVPNVDYFADADGDGFGDVTTLISTCVQPQGYVTDNTDCNDNDASIYPGAQEICNDVDDDCNDLIDDGLVFITYYADADGDSFGDINNPLDACLIPDGYVTDNTDCNDNNANQNNASTEICNGEDDDCDGQIDNGLIFLDYYADLDSDGFGAGAATNSCVDLGAGYVSNNTDCDDSNSNTNPNATEACNTIDDNCDGQIDEGVQTVYFIDNDGDTYGNPSVSILACTQPIGYTPDDTDCNDTDANINPGAEDIGGNGIDENCDGEIDNSIFELNATISLYPNPTRSELNIQVNSSIIGSDFYIFDAVGKLVFKQQLLSTQTSILVSNFADGNYIVRVGEVVKRFEVMK